MSLYFCYLKTKWFKMSASWPVAGFWFWTSPPSIHNDKLIMPAWETWNMGNSRGNTPDYGLLPEDNFLTEGQRTESTQISGAALRQLSGGSYLEADIWRQISEFGANSMPGVSGAGHQRKARTTGQSLQKSGCWGMLLQVLGSEWGCTYTEQYITQG